MPPVGAALGALGAAVGSAFVSAGSAIAGVAGASFAAKAFGQVVAGIALSAISNALLKPKGPDAAVPGGTRLQGQTGEESPDSFILGRWATAGDLVYHNSHGENDGRENAIYTFVVELGSVPAPVARILVNGEYVTLLSPPDDNYGHPVEEYRWKGKDYLYIRTYDGLQSSADPGLIAIYGDDPDRPWQADMIGEGIPYAVVHANYRPTLHRKVPQCVYEFEGIRLYDPRYDTSVGGTGTQRLDTPSTWHAFGAPENANPAVIAYNVFLGINDPVTGEHMFGGRVPQRQLPLAVWAAAMNKCEVDRPGPDGDEWAYRAGIEVRLDDDTTPADVLLEIGKAADMRFAQVGGEWHVHVGAPGAAVWAFTDDDVIITEPETFDPFPGLDQTFSGISATYYEPDDGWVAREAPQRHDATYEEEDGRRNVAGIDFRAVFARGQVQRLMRAWLKDGRRFRRHILVVPPAARPIAPLDVVEWNVSERFGYETKDFIVDAVEDLPNGCHLLGLREVDPSDYDFDVDDLLPSTVGFLSRPPFQLTPPNFSFFPGAEEDENGNLVKPTIEIHWNPNTLGVRGVRWRARLKDIPTHQPVAGEENHDPDDGASEIIGLEIDEGVPVEIDPGVVPQIGFTTNIALGIATIRGLLPDTDYEVRAKFTPDGEWTAWTTVHTFDLRVRLEDLTDDAAQQISDALTNANQALADIGTVDQKSDQALILAQQAIDATGVSGRILPNGWIADQGFANWTAAALDDWTETGGEHISQDVTGFFNNSAALLVAPTDTPVGFTASSEVAGQMNDFADYGATYVVMSLMVEYVSGSLSSGRARIEWKQQGTSTWTRGTFPLNTSVLNGDLHLLGVRPVTSVLQQIQLVMQKPNFTAEAVQMLFRANTGAGPALSIVVHGLDIAVATEAQVAAVNNRTFTTAAIDEVMLEVTGITDALAANQTTIEAQVNTLSSSVTDIAVAQADLESATAVRFITADARDLTNLILNPDFAADGTLASGVAPQGWQDMPPVWQVVARNPGSGNARLATAPALSLIRADPDGAFRALDTSPYIPINPGERIILGLDYAVDAGGSADLRLQARWFDEDLDNFANEAFDVSTTPATWQRTESDEIAAPAGVAYVRFRLARFAGGSGDAYMTRITGRRIDPELDRRLLAVVGLRAQAGNPATLELISMADKDQEISTARISADNILLDGTVGARQLVIGEFGNLVPDDQFIAGDWFLPSGFAIGSEAWDLGSINSLQYTYSGGSGFTTAARSEPFPVKGGEEYMIRYAYRPTAGQGGATVSARGRIFWFDVDGVQLAINSNPGAPSVGKQVERNVYTAPDAARTAEFRVDIDLDQTDGSVRIGGPEVRRVADGAVEIKDGSITAPKVLVDEALLNKITVTDYAFINGAHIGDLTVDTIHIANFAISRRVWSFVEFLSIDPEETWTTISSIAITRRSGTTAHLWFSFGWDDAPSNGARFRCRLRRGGTTIKTFGYERDDDEGELAKIWEDDDNVSGSVTYTLQVEGEFLFGDMQVQDVSFYIQELTK